MSSAAANEARRLVDYRLKGRILGGAGGVAQLSVARLQRLALRESEDRF